MPWLPVCGSQSVTALFIAALFVTAAAIGRRSPPPVQLQTPVQKRKLSRRTKVSAALILVGVPAVLFVGSCYFDLKNYYLMALLVLLLSIPLLYKMRWGHYITTLGGNPVALRRCGVRTGAWRISTFAVMGFLAALAGIIISARLNSAEPNAGLNMEMDAITAVILGGTPLHGGSAALAGTAVAVLLLGTIRNGLTLMSVSSYYQQFITGAILLCAVVTAEIRERRRRLH